LIIQTEIVWGAYGAFSPVIPYWVQGKKNCSLMGNSKASLGTSIFQGIFIFYEKMN
jgi:hypothetical protein